MSKGSPKTDGSSLGNILLEWEIITRDQLERALKEQETLRGDDLLGRLLVAMGACSEDEVNTAMSAQTSMRSSGGHKYAIAVADLAIERQRRHSIIAQRDRVIEKGREVARSITGGQYPSITASMLAKNSSD